MEDYEKLKKEYEELKKKYEELKPPTGYEKLKIEYEKLKDEWDVILERTGTLMPIALVETYECLQQKNPWEPETKVLLGSKLQITITGKKKICSLCNTMIRPRDLHNSYCRTCWNLYQNARNAERGLTIMEYRDRRRNALGLEPYGRERLSLSEASVECLLCRGVKAWREIFCNDCVVIYHETKSYQPKLNPDMFRWRYRRLHNQIIQETGNTPDAYLLRQILNMYPSLNDSDFKEAVTKMTKA